MPRRLWYVFFAVQGVGLAAMGMGEWTSPTRTSIICRLAAFILLQPGLLLSRALVDKFFWNYFEPELFRYAALGAVLLNTFFAIWLYQFIDALRPKRTN